MIHQKTAALPRLRRAFDQCVTRCTKPLSYVFCILCLALCPLFSVSAVEGARPAYITPPPAVSSGSIVQIIFSLLLVLAAIVLAAWLLKRVNVAQQGSGSLLKVVGGVSVGQRERIVLVEVKDTWLLIGIGPGQIRALHTLEKPVNSHQDMADSAYLPRPAENKFASLLASVLNHQPSDRKRNAS